MVGTNVVTNTQTVVPLTWSVTKVKSRGRWLCKRRAINSLQTSCDNHSQFFVLIGGHSLRHRCGHHTFCSFREEKESTLHLFFFFEVSNAQGIQYYSIPKFLPSFPSPQLLPVLQTDAQIQSLVSLDAQIQSLVSSILKDWGNQADFLSGLVFTAFPIRRAPLAGGAAPFLS